MPQDIDARSTDAASSSAAARLRQRVAAWLARVRNRPLGLSIKLLLLTLSFVMLAEILIFVPSIANYRVTWLNDRLSAAYLASLATETAPGGAVPPGLRDELLRSAQVKGIAVKRHGIRRLVLAEGMGTEGITARVDAHYDLRMMDRAGVVGPLVARFGLIWDAMAVFVGDDGRLLRVTGHPNLPSGDFVEVVLPEAPLKAAMVRHSLNILGLSIIISIITAALVYFALNGLLVQPMMRISENMLHFGQHPEDQSRIIVPSARQDEIGTTERELAHMQGQLAQLLLQKSRLAALGLAVSKINHDLRNMLSSAQLISDRLGTLPDPTVRRITPKLIASLDRAIALCNDTLKFGKAEEAVPHRELFPLRPLLDEVADGLGLPREGGIGWWVDADAALRIDADRDHLYRVLSNISRNAVQALEAQAETLAVGSSRGTVSVKAWREQRRVLIELADDGPGVPPRARAHLFQAFQGSVRRGGTGLGLAIAQELLAAHGGGIELVDRGRGATFRLEVPDRPAV